MKEDELSNVRHTEIKERERTSKKIRNNKNNKRMTNLGSYPFESIVRDMIVTSYNEYNELVYGTAKVVTELSSGKRKKKSKCQKETIMETENEKENRTSRRGTIYNE